MTGCKFTIPWAGQCKKECPDGQDYCKEHVKMKCFKCDKQAVTECDASVYGLMCGWPICGEHTHCNGRAGF